MAVTHRLAAVHISICLACLTIAHMYVPGDKNKTSFSGRTLEAKLLCMKSTFIYDLRAIMERFSLKNITGLDAKALTEGSTKLLTSCILTIFPLLPNEGKNIFIYSLRASKHPKCNIDQPSQIQTLEKIWWCRSQMVLSSACNRRQRGEFWRAMLGCWRCWHSSRDTAHRDAI